jgi:flagellar biogenesis protein FliO
MSMLEMSKSAAFGSGCALRARHRLWQRCRVLWERIIEAGKRPPKGLRLCESLSLGERRFVAVIAYRRSRFLLGGTSGSLVLLANLGSDIGDETASGKMAADSSKEPPC